MAAGADLQQLGGAIAFELSTDEETRQKPIDFNRAQASSFQGMLPHPNGQERFLTCSKSHTVLFCKSLQEGCRTMRPAPART